MGLDVQTISETRSQGKSLGLTQVPSLLSPIAAQPFSLNLLQWGPRRVIQGTNTL